jgi:hypothetical protein
VIIENAPGSTVLSDPQILIKKELQSLILENVNHSAVSPATVVLHAMRDRLKKNNILDKALLDRMSAAVKQGRMAVGVEYALRKIQSFRTMEPTARKEAARSAAEKIAEKQIALPKFLQIALDRMATL